MRKVVFSLLVAVFCFWSTIATAQIVTVQKKQGGTLGHISVGCGHIVTEWDILYDFNKSRLPKPVQIHPGVWDVRVFEGDSVFVPDDWDCSRLSSELAVVTSRPMLEEKTVSAPEGTTAGSEPRNEPVRSLWWFQTGIPFGITVLALLCLLVLLLMLYLHNRRNRRVGEPVFPGGIAVDEPQRIEERFNRIAERRYGEANPSADLAVERPQRVSPIESGFLNGHGRVQYRDRSVDRRLENEPAYRARFRFPDGTEQDLFFLQVCANDVHAGTRYHGFRFSASRVIIPAPTAPVQQQVEPVSVPAEPIVPAETLSPATPSVSQNHQESVFAKIRIFDENGKIMVEMEGVSLPSIEIERGPQGTKVSRRGQ